VLIKDKRDPHGISEVYNTQVRMEISNPTETGLYEVLERPGQFDTMLVLYNPHSGRGSEDFVTVVRKSDPRSWLNVHRNRLWVRVGTENISKKAELTKYIDVECGDDVGGRGAQKSRDVLGAEQARLMAAVED
jgi:hypothetical protein